METKVIDRLEFEINKTPSGELRNLLCDANILLRQQELRLSCAHQYVYKILHDHAAADVCTKCGFIKKQ